LRGRTGVRLRGFGAGRPLGSAPVLGAAVHRFVSGRLWPQMLIRLPGAAAAGRAR
jgi:hypothetical protein